MIKFNLLIQFMENFDYLKGIKTIAIIGLSDKPEQASYQVAEFLFSKGFQIIPVNPMIKEVFGLKSYSSLAEIPHNQIIDLVDIFRRSQEVMPIVKDAISRGVNHIWMQEGIKNEDALRYAELHGATVASDICLMKTLKKIS